MAEDISDDDHRMQLAFIKGVINEFHTCSDAGRVWTGNWDSSMIARVQASTQIEYITKKQCRRLRVILREMYAIIAQGVNDINDIRHGVGMAQAAHTRRELQERSMASNPKGQTSILDYLIDTRGRTGMERQVVSDCVSEDDSNESQHSDNSIELNRHWQSEMDQDDGIRYPTADECFKVSSVIHGAEHNQQCLAQVGKYTVTANSLQRLITGGAIDNAIVDSYLHTLETQHHGIKCMGSSFFSKLYNPGGTIRHMPRDTFNMGYASQHFNNLDITRYRLILVPVLAKRHWSLIVINMEQHEIRYLNPQGGDDPNYLIVIKRWLLHRWGAQQNMHVASDSWRCLRQGGGYTPQQTDDNSCGVFILMFATLLAMG